MRNDLHGKEFAGHLSLKIMATLRNFLKFRRVALPDYESERGIFL